MYYIVCFVVVLFFFSSRRRHTRCALVTGVQTCALPISKLAADGRLDLDRTIASYGTSLRLPGHAEQQAKVADILSHRLGLARNAYDGRLESGVDPVEIRHELGALTRSEEHTSELQSLMRISYAVFCLKKKRKNIKRKQ